MLRTTNDPAESSRQQRNDRLAIAFLVILPLALYLPSAFHGTPVIPGDDLTQNEPLRVLAGEMIRSGRLPAWDPLIWSGTPLLAGWNAGAMFPGTWLFAALPQIGAWTINFCAAPLLAGTGCFVFFRQRRIGTLGALAGALLFSYTGFLSGQLVHVGLAQGTGLTPWMLVGIDLLATRTDGRGRAAGIALVGGAFGLVVLAGDPRAVTSAVVIAGVDVLALCYRNRAAWLRFARDVALGVGLGGALGAVQWMPGLAFLRASQRSGSAYSFYATGSLGVKAIVRGLLVPFLLGGNGNFGLPLYTGPYNLPEVTIGVGLVAVVAAVAYLPILWEHFATYWHRRPPTEDRHALGTIYSLGVIGTVLTLGSLTPFGPLLARIPLFGGERLQNRNAVIFDFALAWLVAYLVEDRGAPLLGRTTRAVRPPTRYLQRGGATLPALGAIALCAAALADPAGLLRHLDVTGSLPAVVLAMRPYLIATIVLGAAIVGFIAFGARIGPRARVAALCVLVLADVTDYVANSSFATVPASVLATANPSSAQLGAVVGADGRFALFNPAYGQGGPATDTIPELGVTDLNILHSIASVQGYGSIVSGDYQSGTATHLFEDLDTTGLNQDVFDNLDLTTLVSLPTYFSEPISDRAELPVAEPPGAGHRTAFVETGPNVTAPLPYSAGPWTASASSPAWFVLPQPTDAKTLTVVLDRTGSPLPSTVTVSSYFNDRRLQHETVPVRGNRASFSLNRDAANFFAVSTPAARSGLVGAVVLTTVDPGQRLLLDGALEGDLQPGHWSYHGSIGAFSVFSNRRTDGLAWLQAAHSSTPDTADATGTVQVISNTATAPQVFEFASTSAATLVRSEAFSPGWSATLEPVGGGRPRVLPVRQFGLIEAIAVPKGRYVVTFNYDPWTLLTGFSLTAAGTVVFLGLLAFFVLEPRMRRRSGRVGASVAED